jgi:signal transduction histidine kinase
MALAVIALVAVAATWYGAQYFARETIDAETRRLAKSWHFQIITTLAAGSRSFITLQIGHSDQRNLRQLVSSTNLYRVNLIDKSGTIFWSTNRSLVGKVVDAAALASVLNDQISINHSQQKARFLDGMESLFITGKASPNDLHSVAAAMLPVKSGTELVGALQISLDNTKLIALHKANIQRATIVLCAVFAAMFLLSAWFSWRHNRLRRRQMAALSAAHDRAVEAETEAREMAAEVQRVNDEIVSLNAELDANITRLRQAQDEIIRKGKMAQLGQLTATIAHDIRNPLGAVRTAAFLLERKFAAECQGIAKPLARINNGIARCDGIISELLDFARTSELKTEPLVFDDWLLANVQEQAANLPDIVAIECHLGIPGVEIEIDTSSMQRVLANFLGNASEAMVGKGDVQPSSPTENPKIIVTTQRSERGVELRVTDNGPGIPADLLEKVRQPLFTTKNFGIGLGLPAVEKVLQQHGGGLDIHSVEGEGTTMITWFPIGAMPQGNLPDSHGPEPGSFLAA